MRYITIPQPVDVPGAFRPDKTPLTMPLSEFIEFYLGNLPDWRQNTDWLVAYFEIIDGFKMAKPGTCLALDNGHVEKIHQVFRGMQLRPELTHTFMKLMKPILTAPAEKPKDVVMAEPEPPANGAAATASQN